MANYSVIGGDNKEYGPVTDADVRQWIAEGRLNTESRVKAESDAEFRALGQFPEFATAFAPQTAPAPVPAPLTTAEMLDRDYELDIGECFSRGWEVYKENFGIVFGGFLIFMLVQMGAGGALGMIRVPFATWLLQQPTWIRIGYDLVNSCALTLVTGPMMGGVFWVYLRLIRGEKPGIGEVFSGFQRAYLQLFLGAFLLALIGGVCTLPFQYVLQDKAGPLFQQMQHMQTDPTAMQKVLPGLMAALTSSLPVLCICMVPFTFFVVSFQFTSPLIIDKQLNFTAAMGASLRMVMKHWWYVFGLTVVAGLVSMLGIFACCIGLLFTVPIGMMAMMIAYETIFGGQKN